MCMLGKRKFSIYKRKYVGAVFTYFLKAFDTATHDLLIAKLAAYGCSQKSFNLTLSDLKNRSQRVNVVNTFNSREEIIAKAPLYWDLYCSLSS